MKYFSQNTLICLIHCVCVWVCYIKPLTAVSAAQRQRKSSNTMAGSVMGLYLRNTLWPRFENFSKKLKQWKYFSQIILPMPSIFPLKQRPRKAEFLCSVWMVQTCKHPKEGACMATVTSSCLQRQEVVGDQPAVQDVKCFCRGGGGVLCWTNKMTTFTYTLDQSIGPDTQRATRCFISTMLEQMKPAWPLEEPRPWSSRAVWASGM